MISSMIKEFSLRHHELENKKIDSLYFGGGTPSILQASEIGKIIDEANRYFEFSSDMELTLEANPDDLNAAFLKEIKNIRNDIMHFEPAGITSSQHTQLKKCQTT